MQDFSQANYDDTKESLERFEKMNIGNKELYFDVHEIEQIIDIYSDNHRLDKAEEALNIGLRQHPHSTALQARKAFILLDNGEIEHAHQMLKSLSKIETSNPDIFSNLAYADLQIGEVASAVKHYHQAAQLAFEDQADTLFDAGYNLNQEGYYQEALPFLEGAAQQASRNENILFELAFVYDKLGFTSKGIKIYQILLDINPFSENAWYNLGILYNKTGKFHKAIDAYEFTLAISPYHAEAFFNKGNSLAQLGEYEEALDCYLEYASYGRDNVVTYQYIADCYDRLGNYDYAIRFFRRVTRLEPSNADGWYGLGAVFLEKKLFKESFGAFEQAISLAPSNPDFWYGFGKACTGAELTKEAIQCFKKTIKLSPEDTSAWLELNKTYSKTDPSQASTFFNNQIIRHETNPSVQYVAAVINFNKGLFSKAISHLVNAFDKSPEDLEMVLDYCPELLSEPEIAKIIKNFQS